VNYTHFVKQPNLKLKTWPKQLLGYLPLAFELPYQVHQIMILRNSFSSKVRKIILMGVGQALSTQTLGSLRVPGQQSQLEKGFQQTPNLMKWDVTNKLLLMLWLF